MSKEKKKALRREHRQNAVVAAIPLIGFCIFALIPLILAALVSMTELHSTNLREMEFIGLENFKTILTNGDGRTYASYLSTVCYALNMPIGLALGLFIANKLNQLTRFQRFFRSVYFIPSVCSVVVISLTFRQLYDPLNGVLNSILSFLGFEPVGWLTQSPVTFMASVVVMAVWTGLGSSIVMFQAALANVDQGYYEAAKIDGATPFQMFWKITWPAISPTTSYLITMRLIGALQAMAETFTLVKGNTAVPSWPGSEAWVSDTVVKHIYNMVFEQPYKYGYGLGAAGGWILAAVVLIVTRINLKLQERWVNYDF